VEKLTHSFVGDISLIALRRLVKMIGVSSTFDFLVGKIRRMPFGESFFSTAPFLQHR
jgi:hypothetical protein